MELHRHLFAQFNAVRFHPAAIRALRDSGRGGLPQGGAECRMRAVIGGEYGGMPHLNDEHHAGRKALLPGLNEGPEMPYTPLGGSVREKNRAAFFQRDPLDFQKRGAGAGFQTEIQTGIPEEGLPANLPHRPRHARRKPAGQEGFFHDPVRRLTVYVDKPIPFFHRDQGIGGLSQGVPRWFQINPRAGHQKFPATAGVPHMDENGLSIQIHMGYKPVWPAQKPCGDNVLIGHNRRPLSHIVPDKAA